jgi:IS1 family transposase
LAETVGVRAAGRLARVDQGTVLRILESAGEHCARFLDAKVRDVKVSLIQADEVFSYVGCKPVHTTEDDPERGAFFMYFCVAQKEKLIINYRVAKRCGEEAREFLRDLRSRVSTWFQFTTDSWRGYVDANYSSGNVQRMLHDVCDYATETKRFKKDYAAVSFADRFWAPKVIAVARKARFGNPDLSVATTCHIERTNLSLRTFARRFVRCTINFSKKLENHRHAVALFVATFNFCKIHKSLGGRTPAQAAGLTDHVWTVAELLSATI